jgi:hypothetical protein
LNTRSWKLKGNSSGMQTISTQRRTRRFMSIAALRVRPEST